MLPLEQLTPLLRDLDPTTFRSRCYRVTQLRHLRTLTSSEGAWASHNRYTRPELSQAYYLADGPDQAMLEATRQLLDYFSHRPLPAYVIFPVEVRLRRVLDLTDETLYDTLHTSLAELTGDWRAELERGGSVTLQRLGEAAFVSGYSAIRYPSAPRPERSNLVVFSEHLQATGSTLRFEIDSSVEDYVRWQSQSP